MYHPGERVFGTTALLYTALMATTGAVSGGVATSFPTLALMLNALCNALTCVLLIYLGWRVRRSYAGAGAELVWAIAPSSVTFAVGGNVGVLGFFSEAHNLDTVGLNSPIASQYHPLPPALHAMTYAVAPDLIMDQRPDYVVIREIYGRAGLLLDPRFGQLYRLRQKLTTDVNGGDGLLIFERINP